jgi:putative Ca2+/H+ antiporter (TMEM165/GDT1 family)
LAIGHGASWQADASAWRDQRHGRFRLAAPVPLLASPSLDKSMETYVVSALLVALEEMGDRTQLLAIMLATRYRQPIPILFGIFAATLANHALAALAGFYLSNVLEAVWFEYAVALSFVGMAIWALIPDKADDKNHASQLRPGVFLTTAIAFFLIEIGDKTQIATAALAARYQNILIVAAGTTTGMMLANTPAVLLGQAVTRIIPIKTFRIASAVLYLALGLWAVAITAGWVKLGSS